MNVVVVIMNHYRFDFCPKLIFHKVKQNIISDRETTGIYNFFALVLL